MKKTSVKKKKEIQLIRFNSTYIFLKIPKQLYTHIYSCTWRHKMHTLSTFQEKEVALYSLRTTLKNVFTAIELQESFPL